jgi:hypothetical protein
MDGSEENLEQRPNLALLRYVRGVEVPLSMARTVSNADEEPARSDLLLSSPISDLDDDVPGTDFP